MKPINKIPRLIRTATAVIVAGSLAVMVLSAQDDLDTVRQAAEQGDATAQFNLGNMYANGEGVPQDAAEAVRWYRLAAEQGDADAQFNLGVMYANGEGVPKDNAEAVRWYRLAAEQGLASAQFNLGSMCANGEGVLKDNAEAARWFRLAAEQGDADAQFNLGVRYDNGDGVLKDSEARAHVVQHRWRKRERSCQGGSGQSCVTCPRRDHSRDRTSACVHGLTRTAKGERNTQRNHRKCILPVVGGESDRGVAGVALFEEQLRKAIEPRCGIQVRSTILLAANPG